MPPSNYSSLPAISEGATPLDLAAGGALTGQPAANVSLPMPSTALTSGSPLDRAAMAAPRLSTGQGPISAFLNTVATGESGGSDPYHETYGGGHFGWRGIPDTGSGRYGFTKTTWDETAKHWMAIHPDQPAPNFDNPADQDKLAWFKASEIYKQNTGQDLFAAIKAGKVDWSALAGTWPSLNRFVPGGDATTKMLDAGRKAAQEYHQELQGDIATAQKAADEYGKLASAAPPGSAEQDKLLQQQYEAMNRASSALDKLSKEPPVYKPVDALKNFGSLATVVAIFGGLMSRQPMTAALKAAGTAMQAAQGQRWDEYKTALDTWKAQTQLAIQSLRMHSAEINDILADKNLSITEQQAQLRALYAKFQMPAMLDALKKGDIELQYKIATQMPVIAAQLERNQAVIATMGAQVPLIEAKTHLANVQAGFTGAEYGLLANPFGGFDKGAGGGAPPPSPAAGMEAGGGAVVQHGAGPSAPASSPAQSATAGAPTSPLDIAAEQVISGDDRPLRHVGFGMIGQMRLMSLWHRVYNLAAERGMTGAQLAQLRVRFEGAEAAAKTTGHRFGQVQLYAHEIPGFGDQVLALAKQVPSSRFPDIGAIEREAGRRLGDPHVAAFYGSLLALAGSYARMMSPSGAVHQGLREEIMQVLGKGYDSGTLANTIQVLKNDATIAEEAARSASESATAMVPGAPVPPPPRGAVMAPPGAADDPSGTLYRHSDGTRWLKEGPYFVPVP